MKEIFFHLPEVLDAYSGEETTYQGYLAARNFIRSLDKVSSCKSFDFGKRQYYAFSDGSRFIVQDHNMEIQVCSMYGDICRNLDCNKCSIVPGVDFDYFEMLYNEHVGK